MIEIKDINFPSLGALEKGYIGKESDNQQNPSMERSNEFGKYEIIAVCFLGGPF